MKQKSLQRDKSNTLRTMNWEWYPVFAGIQMFLNSRVHNLFPDMIPRPLMFFWEPYFPNTNRGFRFRTYSVRSFFRMLKHTKRWINVLRIYEKAPIANGNEKRCCKMFLLKSRFDASCISRCHNEVVRMNHIQRNCPWRIEHICLLPENN